MLCILMAVDYRKRCPGPERGGDGKQEVLVMAMVIGYAGITAQDKQTRGPALDFR